MLLEGKFASLWFSVQKLVGQLWGRPTASLLRIRTEHAHKSVSLKSIAIKNIVNIIAILFQKLAIYI